MITLQELITRGRFIMAEAPSRLRVFQAVDGRRTAKEIATLVGRHTNNVHRDLAALENVGLIQPKLADESVRARSTVWEKVPLARSLPARYFEPLSKRPSKATVVDSDDKVGNRSRTRRNAAELAVPSETEILEIARTGEDQLHEFKAQGTDIRKIVREIAAMLNTKAGGMVLYGIDDEGNIEGVDVNRQQFDQPLQNSVRNSIAPAATVRLASVDVLGSKVLIIVVPPWNRRDVYQFDGKILLRKSTNVFSAAPEEVKLLHEGIPVV
jgi:predicted HTH transcriptional regulator